jgi:hypothetical protein
MTPSIGKCALVILIFIAWCCYCFRDIENYSNAHSLMYEAYVIHLPKNAERRVQFERYYDFNLPCTFVHGVDGNVLDLQQMKDRGILGCDGLRSIRAVQKGIPRTEVRDLGSPGALGVYLSHCQLWENMLKENAPARMIIFEDDAIVQNWTVSQLTTALDSIPADWHIYLMGQPHSLYEEQPLGDGISRVLQFCGLHAYVINRAGAEWLWQKGGLMPVQQQIDTKLTDLTPAGLRIYMHPGFPVIKFSSLLSDVQV